MLKHFWSEDGFEVFESAALAKGGIVLAFVIGSIVIAIVGGQYFKAEDEFVGNQIEAGQALIQIDGQTTLKRFR